MIQSKGWDCWIPFCAKKIVIILKFYYSEKDHGSTFK